MLKSLAYLFTIILSFSASSQYSQNIDTLSKREIKKLIMSIDGKHPVKMQLAKNETGKVVGFAFFVTGIALLLDASTRPGPSNDSEIDLGGIIQTAFGNALTISGVAIIGSAYVQYNKELKDYHEYLKSQNVNKK